MQNIKLSELIDVKILQKIQDILSDYIGVAALITDEKGVPITEGSNFSAFCNELVRKSELGCIRCNECDRNGALDSLRNKEVSVYICHAGLVDFSAPIMLEGQMIGCLVGGQIRMRAVDNKEAANIARVLGINPDKYIEEANKVGMMEFAAIEKAAKFMADMASIISQIAYVSYDDRKNIIQLESATRSQADYMVDMYNNIKQVMGNLTASAKEGQDLFTGAISEDGQALLSQAYNSVELSKMSTSGMNLIESAYNVRSLINGICDDVANNYEQNNNTINISFTDRVPQLYYGDEKRIAKVIHWFVREANKNTINGIINIDISDISHGYGSLLHFHMSDNGPGMSEDWLMTCRNDLSVVSKYLITDVDNADTEFRAIGVVIKQLSADIEVDSELGKGTVIDLKIPQLTINTL